MLPLLILYPLLYTVSSLPLKVKKIYIFCWTLCVLIQHVLGQRVWFFGTHEKWSKWEMGSEDALTEDTRGWDSVRLYLLVIWEITRPSTLDPNKDGINDHVKATEKCPHGLNLTQRITGSLIKQRAEKLIPGSILIEAGEGAGMSVCGKRG